MVIGDAVPRAALRFGRTVRDLASGQWRPMSAADYASAVDALALPTAVPDLVRGGFDKAAALLSAAWERPQLSEAAELEALRALEFALRWRLDPNMGGRSPGLAGLLRRAQQEGSLRNTPNLRAARRAHFNGVDFLEAVGTDWPDAEVLDHLVVWLPEYRNNLAHGGQQHMFGGLAVLNLVGEIIRQLWCVDGSLEGRGRL